MRYLGKKSLTVWIGFALMVCIFSGCAKSAVDVQEPTPVSNPQEPRKLSLTLGTTDAQETESSQEKPAVPEGSAEENLKDIALANVGDIVKFGSYEQDADPSNGSEEIEWIVLDKSGDETLLLSKYALDVKVYHEKWATVTWETCALRGWLNNEFYSKAFTDTEKAYISLSALDTPKNPHYGTKGGNATQDHVFVLSLDEVKKYFSFGGDKGSYWEYNGDAGLRAGGTRQAYEKGLYLFDMDAKTERSKKVGQDYTTDASCRWWLRSTGDSDGTAAMVSVDGAASVSGFTVDHENIGVRPALWVKGNL